MGRRRQNRRDEGRTTFQPLSGKKATKTEPRQADADMKNLYRVMTQSRRLSGVRVAMIAGTFAAETDDQRDRRICQRAIPARISDPMTKRRAMAVSSRSKGGTGTGRR